MVVPSSGPDRFRMSVDVASLWKLCNFFCVNCTTKKKTHKKKKNQKRKERNFNLQGFCDFHVDIFCEIEEQFYNYLD